MYNSNKRGRKSKYTPEEIWDYIKKELSIMDFYDFSDTLAKIDWAADNIPAAIIAGRTLYKPQGQFAVITAQQDNPAIHAAVTQWLKTHYGAQCARVYFVTGGESNIIKAKSRILAEQNADSFTDNNTNILRGIRAELPSLRLYQVTDGKRSAWR